MARRSTAHWPRVRGDAGVSRPRARAAGRARRYVGTRCAMTRTGDRAAGSRTVRRPHHCCAASCLCSRKSRQPWPPRALPVSASFPRAASVSPAVQAGSPGVQGQPGVCTASVAFPRHPLAVRFSGRAPLFRGTRLYEDLEITYLFRGLEMAEGSLSLRYSMERSKCRVTNVSVQPSPCFLGSSVSPFPSSVNRIGEGSFPFGNGKSVILFFEGFSVLCAKS